MFYISYHPVLNIKESTNVFTFPHDSISFAIQKFKAHNTAQRLDLGFYQPTSHFQYFYYYKALMTRVPSSSFQVYI